MPAKVESAPKSGELRVTAPLIAVSTKGGTVRHLYFGDLIGDDVTKESVDHLRNLGFVSSDAK